VLWYCGCRPVIFASEGAGPEDDTVPLVAGLGEKVPLAAVEVELIVDRGLSSMLTDGAF